MRCTCGQDNPISARACPRCNNRLIFGMPPRRFGIDAGIAGGLLLALGLVFLLDLCRGSTEIVQLAPLRLAVTPPEFDDIGKLLDSFGKGYQYEEIEMDDVLDPELLGQYDVVFLTSGLAPEEWSSRQKESDRRGGKTADAREDLVETVRHSLRTYVGNGGTLYVSDWQFPLLVFAFEELLDRDKIAKGKKGSVTADVVDMGLRRRLGQDEIELHFDKDDWHSAAFAGPEVNALLVGTFDTAKKGRMTAPLLVEFPYRNGNVIFTSFHNEKQDSETEQELLRYLVFATVTAHTDAEIHQTMVRGGFSPVDRNLLSASGRQQTDIQVYNCRGRRHLQFVLGFANRGAELKLVVTDPAGKNYEKTGTSTVVIEISQAKKGKWKYSATAISVPYENFPFTLTVGEK